MCDGWSLYVWIHVFEIALANHCIAMITWLEAMLPRPMISYDVSVSQEAVQARRSCDVMRQSSDWQFISVLSPADPHMWGANTLVTIEVKKIRREQLDVKNYSIVM